MMQEIKIKEKLDYEDFMKANFPQALQAFYKKRVFKINVAFGIVYFFISLYIFYQSFLKEGKIQAVHYSFLLFTLLFFFLAYYLAKRETKLYKKMFSDIQNLETEYVFTPQKIRVSNKNTTFSYDKKDLQNITVLDKWLVFDFENGERISLYKPNISPEAENFLRTHFQEFMK